MAVAVYNSAFEQRAAGCVVKRVVCNVLFACVYIVHQQVIAAADVLFKVCQSIDWHIAIGNVRCRKSGSRQQRERHHKRQKNGKKSSLHRLASLKAVKLGLVAVGTVNGNKASVGA